MKTKEFEALFETYEIYSDNAKFAIEELMEVGQLYASMNPEAFTELIQVSQPTLDVDLVQEHAMALRKRIFCESVRHSLDVKCPTTDIWIAQLESLYTRKLSWNILGFNAMWMEDEFDKLLRLYGEGEFLDDILMCRRNYMTKERAGTSLDT
ncbi:hypothetical protein CYMTET_7458 [Cymbomonas tetramitiformis]|uniref:Uncharacterized protein n=1 Tax=Cymbomonas tetramitiformis TaxID=36881 RepID=A0AAE0GVG2_9CHLO|nr:hypothetical protein CYMTET_7458 [Cymbomonas tetramitiformis]